MEQVSKPVMLCLAGFGDQADLFQPLQTTSLNDHLTICPLNLPGFGAKALTGETTLYTLANEVASEIKKTGARYLLVHSVASIIGGLAAEKAGAQIDHIFSLEGNLTDKDAYFSGKAAGFTDPISFRNSFLHKLEGDSVTDPILKRYWQRVAKADPQALWQLGCSAHEFSLDHVPGDRLQAAAPVTYFYNPENLHKDSLGYLAKSSLDTVLLEGASHWPTLDQPNAVAAAIMQRVRGASAIA